MTTYSVTQRSIYPPHASVGVLGPTIWEAQRFTWELANEGMLPGEGRLLPIHFSADGLAHKGRLRGTVFSHWVVDARLWPLELDEERLIAATLVLSGGYIWVVDRYVLNRAGLDRLGYAL